MCWCLSSRATFLYCLVPPTRYLGRAEAANFHTTVSSGSFGLFDQVVAPTSENGMAASVGSGVVGGGGGGGGVKSWWLFTSPGLCRSMLFCDAAVVAQMATMGPKGPIMATREALEGEIADLHEKYKAMNDGRNPMKGIEPYVQHP